VEQELGRLADEVRGCPGGPMMQSFDERSRMWDEDPAKRARAATAAAAVRGEVDLHRGTSLLEYGAGTGLLSQELAAAVGSITVADPSSGMRVVMQEKADAGVLPGARVLDLDLSRDPVPEETFDVVVAAMVLHHIPDLTPVLRGFAQLVEPGGSLCVVDLEHEDGSFHGDGFDGHDGFDREELAAWLRAAGFETPVYRVCFQLRRHERDYPLVLAVSRRLDRRAGR
jgi:2-polyprenyl-3-methyl-5-hydroxy-6-metoxy-1,4-benzoquinol methylase